MRLQWLGFFSRRESSARRPRLLARRLLVTLTLSCFASCGTRPPRSACVLLAWRLLRGKTVAGSSVLKGLLEWLQLALQVALVFDTASSTEIVATALPNVRAKRATTAGRQARAGENVPRTARPGLVACRWRSA